MHVQVSVCVFIVDLSYMHVQLCVQDKQTNSVCTLIGKTLTFCLHECFFQVSALLQGIAR